VKLLTGSHSESLPPDFSTRKNSARARGLSSRRVHEPAPLGDAELDGELLADVEEVLRDVAEDHAPRLAHARQATEADQPVPAADVEQNVAFLERCAVQNAIAYRREVLEHSPASLGVTAVVPP
jgi:hypothetical protein